MTGPERRAADLLLATATLAALAVVPDWPHRHVSDPSYWGVVGFVVLVAGLLWGRRDSWSPGSAHRRMVVAFLVLVPVVYVADRLRYGGTSLELGIQVAGLGLWIALAVRARRSDTVLWLGCVLHGLWDAAHFGRVGFVPEWYAAACLAADTGLGAFVLLRLKRSTGSEAATGAAASRVRS
ncbi:MAG TPA: hypothetical protein VLL48_06395 [Longimicrobiales bacterium]|nr:hypothetical protein [Longimicrobiales bacterium]